ncbi:RNA polymerase sigma factor SigF [Solihabitans fulvus]|uniref:RNA polymerase sigma factor SigF n=1 Tax=Solihabitans fulvus TaxID=1892852 RepID=A0A5B2WQ26_9PSEU|nr:RNA polymerase sigma factor SigF [Solihabitans fulvus]KAA2252539.1 RNA polymerase sigma factor SigF [Solihabitans fulvus]
MSHPKSTSPAPDTARHEYSHLAPLFLRLAELAEDDPARGEVRDELVTGHLPLAQHIAQRFSNRGEQSEDLVQVATIGLIKAIDRFDLTREVDFLSFAVPTIMGEVRRHFRDTSWSVRVPRRLKNLHLSINSAVGELSQQLGRSPRPSELAAHLDVSVEEVYEGLAAANAHRSTSLDDLLVNDDSTSLGDTLGEPDVALEEIEQREALHPLIQQLPKRERTIIVLRFFANMTQTQIAEQVGVSQMHVSRLLSRTLARLRRDLADGE